MYLQGLRQLASALLNSTKDFNETRIFVILKLLPEITKISFILCL